MFTNEPLKLSKRDLSSDESCLYLKFYIPPQEADATLLLKVVPLLNRFLEGTGYERFFFIRYVDKGGYHLRLRLFAPQSRRMHQRRREIIAFAMAKTDGLASVQVVVDRYRPEFKRYGGPTGVRLAEYIFDSSSRCALDYLIALNAKQAPGKFQFAALSGEVLLSGLRIKPKQRDNALNPYGWSEEIVKAIPVELSSRLVELIERAKRGPGSSSLGVSPALSQALKQLYARVNAVSAWLPSISKSQQIPIPALVSAYYHMHVNRLSIDNSEERLLRALAGKSS